MNFSTKAAKAHSDAAYREGDFLVFGKETKGLDPEVIERNRDRAVRIPMRPTLRCLNLSNSVAVAAYEVLRRYDYFGGLY